MSFESDDEWYEERIAALEAEVERLGYAYVAYVDCMDSLRRSDKAHGAALARAEKAEAALRPFAIEAARYDPPEGDDDQEAWASAFTIGQLRAARATPQASGAHAMTDREELAQEIERQIAPEVYPEDPCVTLDWKFWQVILAALRSRSAGATVGVPDGWVLVPKEPSEEMIETGRDACYPPVGRITFGVIYKAALSAAPPAPAPIADRERKP